MTQPTAPTFAIETSASQLIVRARELTGIDIVDSDIEASLRLLLQALNTEAGLSRSGAAATEERLLRLLCNRLRMERDFRQHPEIEAQNIARPLFLTGGGRTGSTKLHKLLAASGDFLYMPFWQGYSLALRTGDRGESPAARIEDADRHVQWFDAHAPQARLVHAYETHEPEEETLLLEHCLCGMYLMAFFYVPTYVQWSMQYFRDQLLFMKRTLKYLQWQFHDGDPRPWVFKCPIYFGIEPLLAEVFPDAMFVATHRNPIATLASQASLLDHYGRAYSDVDRMQEHGLMMLEGTAMTAQRHMAGRDEHPELKFLDVGYESLIQDAEQAVERIYGHMGMPFSDKARQAIRNWERENGQHKHGAHKYSLADYALRTEQVNGKFADYIERFKGSL